MIKEKIIRDGNFTAFVRGVLCVVGIAIGFLGLKHFHSMTLALIGLVIAAIGGYSSRAAMLKIKPFDNSYKKARDSYKAKDGEEDKSK